MPHFRATELADEYRVNRKTVYNWIAAAKAGKIELILEGKGSSTFIVDTPANRRVLEQLAENGKKHRNSAYHKEVQPRAELYDIYSHRQILDMITNLNVRGEVPLQYNYLQDGAKNWKERMDEFEKKGSGNSLMYTIELIEDNLDILDRFLKGKKKVNVIDLGVGNGRPVKELLSHLLKRSMLHRYIGIDISPAMLGIANQNINEWFGDAVKFEGFVRDITTEQFDDLIVSDMLDEDADVTINLVLLLGGTSVNFHAPNDAFKPIFNSMHRNDLFIHTLKPDTAESRRYLDLGSKPGSESLVTSFGYILKLLNIDESLYDLEAGFDEVKAMRYVRAVLKTAIQIRFDLGGTKKRTVSLEKGESILLFRAWHLSEPELLDYLGKAGFTFLRASLTKDLQYLMSISGVENRTDAKRA